MSLKLLVTDTYHAHSLAKLSGSLACEIVRSANPDPTEEELQSVDGLLIRSRTAVDRNLLGKAPRLRWVVSATSGFDHIDVKACQEVGITCSYTPDANAASAAELTVALMLNLLRRLPENLSVIPKNQWRKQEMRGHSLQGRTLGIVGLGRIGRRVARIAGTLGMKITAYDPYVNESEFTLVGAERAGFTEVLVAADVLTLHVPLTKETHHLLNYSTLRLMNRGAYLINASRGAVIQESELALALDEGLLAGVGLDVFEKEPLAKESRIRGRTNALLTPHIGAFTEEALEAASMEAVDRTIEFFKKGQTINCLPSGAPWFSLLLPVT